MISENHITQSVVFTPPYTMLAEVYDAMMAHVDYKRWAKYIRAILKKESYRNGVLLDIGCGTGEFLRRMLKYKYHLTGCDASFEMIDVARKKLPRMRFHNSSLPQLAEIPHGTYDIIVCLFDTMNYLLDEPQIRRSLESIYQKLRSPGIFIFDVVTRSHCLSHFQNYTQNEVLESQIAYSRESEFDAANDIQLNYIRIFTANGVFEEIHKQRIHDLQSLKQLIVENSPFRLEKMLGDFSFQEGDQNSSRVHFILKKYHD